eukprot:5145705-Pleurochrysis_carterae.AAC.1
MDVVGTSAVHNEPDVFALLSQVTGVPVAKASRPSSNECTGIRGDVQVSARDSGRCFDRGCCSRGRSARRFISTRVSVIGARLWRRGFTHGIGHARGRISGVRWYARRIRSEAMKHQTGVCPVGSEHGSRTCAARHT